MEPSWEAYGGDQQPRHPRQPRAYSDYYLEYLPHVHRFLFSGAGESGCQYLRTTTTAQSHFPVEAQVWLGSLLRGTVGTSDGPSWRGLQLVGAKGPFMWETPEPFGNPRNRLSLRVTLEPETGIELWLNRSGVAVVSISLLCQRDSEPTRAHDAFFDELLKLNHALTTAQKAVWLRGTGDHQPMHLHQWVRDLLRPLWDNHENDVRFELRGKAYTVLEAGLVSDQSSAQRLPQCHEQLLRNLSHLAQIHPPSHPGEAEYGHAQRLIINNEHLCCIDQSGAAHAAIVRVQANSAHVAPVRKSETHDSPNEIPIQSSVTDGRTRADSDNFGADETGPNADADGDNAPVGREETSDEYSRKRLRRIQMEYFPGFLLAIIQRMCLQRILDESASASALPPEQQESARKSLLEKVLRFGLEAEFVQVAWRTTIQKHHELAQQACEIQEGLATVRHAMNDFHRMSTDRAAEQQRREAECAANERHEDRMAEGRAAEQRREEAERAAQLRHEETERAERTMQVLEVFIVTFYSVEMAHVLGESFDFHDKPFVGSSLVVVALASFAMGALLVSWKWLQKRGPKWTIISLFIMVTSIHALFVGVNAWRKSQHSPSHSGELRPTVSDDQSIVNERDHSHSTNN